MWEGCFDWWSCIEEAIPSPVRCQRLNIHLAGGPEWLARIPDAGNCSMFKDTVVQSHVLYTDADGVTRLRIRARPNAWHRDDCPWCGRRGLPRYDRQAAGGKVWRGLVYFVKLRWTCPALNLNTVGVQLEHRRRLVPCFVVCLVYLMRECLFR